MSKEELLHKLCMRSGNLEKIKELLSDPDLNVNYKYEDGKTALMICCENYLLEEATLLFNDLRVNVQIQKNDGRTVSTYLSGSGLPLSLLSNRIKIDNKNQILKLMGR